MISRMMKVGVADVRHYSRIAVPDVRRTTEHLNAHLCVCVFACWPHLCCCYCCCVACLFKHHSACSPAEQSDAFVCDDQRQLARLRQNAKRQRVFARPVNCDERCQLVSVMRLRCRLKLFNHITRIWCRNRVASGEIIIPWENYTAKNKKVACVDWQLNQTWEPATSSTADDKIWRCVLTAIRICTEQQRCTFRRKRLLSL